MRRFQRVSGFGVALQFRDLSLLQPQQRHKHSSLILSYLEENEILKTHIQANYALKDEKDFVKLSRHAVKDLNVCQFDDMIS